MLVNRIMNSQFKALFFCYVSLSKVWSMTSETRSLHGTEPLMSSSQTVSKSSSHQKNVGRRFLHFYKAQAQTSNKCLHTYVTEII